MNALCFFDQLSLNPVVGSKESRCLPTLQSREPFAWDRLEDEDVPDITIRVCVYIPVASRQCPSAFSYNVPNPARLIVMAFQALRGTTPLIVFGSPKHFPNLDRPRIGQ